MKDTKISVDWSYLPEGILEMISEKLAIGDYVSFANVCKTWRGIVTQAICAKPLRGFPWLVMSGQYETTTRSCFSVLENKLRLLEMPKSYRGFFMGSFEEWLFMMKRDPDYPRQIKISVMNPLSGVEILLPHVLKEDYRKLMFSKYPGDENCVYMLFTPLSPELIFWTPRAQDWCGFESELFIDGISLNGYFYLLDENNNIMVIDVTNIPSTIKTEFYEVRMPHDHDDNTLVLSRYLVELCGEIILVYRFFRGEPRKMYETYDFKIYKLDLSKTAWVELDSLGDYVLFVSRNCSRCIPAKELGLGMANCIYFTSEYEGLIFTEWQISNIRKGSKISDWGVFNNCSKSFYHRTKSRLKRWPATWITVPLRWYFQKKSS